MRCSPTIRLLALAMTTASVPVRGHALHWSAIQGSAEAYELDLASGTWSAVGPMARARVGHVLLQLGSGEVLAIGGQQAIVDGLHYGPGTYPPPTEIERYDPASRSWTTIGQLQSGRWTHSATLLPSGDVLVHGGQFSVFTYTPPSSPVVSEVFQVATGQSVALAGTQGRDSHTATLLASGKVLVAGGRIWAAGLGTVTTADAELYDPVTQSWTVTGSLRHARRLHAALLLSNGNVLVFGGNDDQGRVPTPELYDPVLGSWADVTSPMFGAPPFDPKNTFLEGYGMMDRLTGVSGGGVLATNGQQAAIRDDRSGRWTAIASLDFGRTAFTATTVSADRVLVAGGWSTTGLSSSRLYDAATGTWTTSGVLPKQVYGHAAAPLANGRVVLSGGVQAPILSVSAGPSVVAPGASVTLYATGGTEGRSLYPEHLGWTLSTNRSGGTVVGSTAFNQWAPTTEYATYTAGPYCGVESVQDVITVSGPDASADITVTVDARGRAPFVVPAEPTVRPGESKVFQIGCLDGVVTWSLTTNASGGVIDPATGAYTAGPNDRGVATADVVTATDSAGRLASTRVFVSAPSPATGGARGGCATGSSAPGSLAVLLALLLSRRRRRSA